MTSPRDPDETPTWNDTPRGEEHGSGQVPRPWDEPSVQDQPIPPPPAFPPPGAWSGAGNPYGEPPAYGAPSYGAPAYGAPQPYSAAGYGIPRRFAPSTAGEATSFAFSRFSRAAGVLIAVTVVVVVATLVLQLALGALVGAVGMVESSARPTRVEALLGGFTYAGNVVVTAVGGFVSAVLSLVMTVGALRIVRTGNAGFADFFELPRGWAGYAGGLTALSTVPALIPSDEVSVVLSLLSLVVWIAVLFAGCHLVDAPGDPVAAFRASARTVGAHLGQTLLLLLITFVLTVVGTLACLVGLLVAVPVAAVALTALYCGFRPDEVPA
jgi:uncharacterized membrane protein